MGIVVEGNDSFVSCVITCSTDGSQDEEFTRLCLEGRKLLREQFQLINTEEPTPLVIDEADVDGDEDDDVQIDI